jgi:hypothetical protein
MASLVVALHLNMRVALGMSSRRGGAVCQHAYTGLYLRWMALRHSCNRKAVLSGSWVRFLRCIGRGALPSPALRCGRVLPCSSNPILLEELAQRLVWSSLAGT